MKKGMFTTAAVICFLAAVFWGFQVIGHAKKQMDYQQRLDLDNIDRIVPMLNREEDDAEHDALVAVVGIVAGLTLLGAGRDKTRVPDSNR